MHTESVRRFSLTRCTTHCACDHTPSSPCQHPALHTDIHDGPLTTSAELAWTGQDDSTRHQTPPFLSPAKLVPTDPGPRPSRRGHRLGRVSGQLPPTHRRRARTSRPRQRQSTTWANGRWCAVMATGPPEPAARPPLRPSTRGSATAPRLHTQRWASQARTGQRTGTTLHDCTTPQEWDLCQLRKRCRPMGRMGSATGSFDLREGFAGILRSSLAQLACGSLATLWLRE